MDAKDEKHECLKQWVLRLSSSTAAPFLQFLQLMAPRKSKRQFFEVFRLIFVKLDIKAHALLQNVAKLV